MALLHPPPGRRTHPSSLSAVVAVLVALSASSLMVACGGDAASGERTSSVFQALGAYNTLMRGLRPVAWYKFDESSGTVAHDSSGRGNHGTYVPGDPAYSDESPMLNVSGAVDDNSTASHYGTASRGSAPSENGEYQGPHMTAPDTNDLSLTKGTDTFHRAGRIGGLRSTWGVPTTSDGPGGWSWVSSHGPHYGVSSAGANINETSATGTFGQRFPAQNRLDTDSQVEVHWTDDGHNATTTEGTFQPLILAARFEDANNFYAATLEEENGVVSLRLSKKVAGVTSSFDSVVLSSTWEHAAVHWIVRLQIDSDRTVGPPIPTLRAKAWRATEPQPLEWTLTATDTAAPLPAGGNAILSSNSGTNSHQDVRFNGYRLQSTGFTVSTWMRPTTERFTSPAGVLCGATQANYVNFVSKQSPGEVEWLFRHYPETAVDPSCGEDRKWATSAYAFSLKTTDPVGNADNKGAGDRHNPAVSLAGGWHHVVGIYDPGDFTDRAAGITICFDGVCYPSVHTDGRAGVGANYADPAYLVNAGNGKAPLRVGVGLQGAASWLQFQGDIDELSVFDYRLTADTVKEMYAHKK